MNIQHQIDIAEKALVADKQAALMKWRKDMPTEDGRYLTVLRAGSMSPSYGQAITWMIRGRWMTGDWQRVMAWMPLPEITEEYKNVED